jgi:hypothetical protein
VVCEVRAGSAGSCLVGRRRGREQKAVGARSGRAARAMCSRSAFRHDMTYFARCYRCTYRQTTHATLCSYMHKCRPSLWRYTCISQLFHSAVQRARNVVDVDDAVLEELLIEQRCDDRSVRIVHRPTHPQYSTYKYRMCCLPHGRDHALEAREQHGGRQVHHFLSLVLIALCGLARTQECKKRVVKVEFDQLVHG